MNATDVHKLTVITYCNTGSLATAGYGTALGKSGKEMRIWIMKSGRTENTFSITSVTNVNRNEFRFAGVIRSLHSQNQLNMAYACETRPYMQVGKLLILLPFPNNNV
jgi:methylthioribose-1-phosphate isomerase